MMFRLAVLVGLMGVPTVATAADERPPSILLISIDTLRADHLSIYGYPRATDTELARRVGGFDRYENAYSTFPLTIPSHASMLSGRFPIELGILNNRHSYPAAETAPRTLAQILTGAGYRTAAVVASRVMYSKATGLQRGFSIYDDLFEAAQNRRTAQEINDRVAPIMEQGGDQPLFLFVHYYDPHEPFRQPDRYGCALRADATLLDVLRQRQMTQIHYHEVLNHRQEEPKWENGRVKTLIQMVARYDAAVRYVTDRVARLIDLWETTPRGPGSLIIITSDHGEGLGQHGFWSHGMNLFEEQIRVPLLVRWPRGGGGRAIEAPVSLIDLAPTILEMSGVPEPAGLPGVTLSARESLPPSSSEAMIFAQRQRYHTTTLPERIRNWRQGDGFAVRGRSFKYIEDGDSGMALFDLRRDPLELLSTHEKKRRVLEKLRRALEEWRGVVSEGESAATLDEEHLKRLRSLGYVD